MKSLHFKGLLASSLFCLCLLSEQALAESEVVMRPYQSESTASPLYLTSNAPRATSVAGGSTTTGDEFEPSLFSGSKLHQYLGIATVGTAAATFLSHHDACKETACLNQPRDTNGLHAQLGKATAALALATVASGLLTHWDDFSLEDGWKDPDNLHVLLGVSGAALMAYAINKSARSTVAVNHAGLAELGAASMVFAIKLTW